MWDDGYARTHGDLMWRTRSSVAPAKTRTTDRAWMRTVRVLIIIVAVLIVG